MTDKIQQVSNYIKEESFISFLQKSRRYIKYNIYGFTDAIIFEIDLKKTYSKVNPKLKLFFRFASEKDIDLMDETQYDYNQITKQYSKERLAKGDRCILALYNDKIIGYVWIMKDYMELSKKKHIILDKKKVYAYRCFVKKEYRGKRIESALYNHATDLLKKEGKKILILTIDNDNKPALKAISKKKARYKITGSLIHIRFFGLKYDYIRKRLRYLRNI